MDLGQKAALIALLLLLAGCGTQSIEQTGGAVAGENVKTFMLTGENFKFMMEGQEGPEIKVNVGDTVRVEFSSTEGFHDWVVDEFQAATERVKTNGTTSVEFVADKAGTFEYYCSVGSHRQMGMKGKLIVVEALS